MTVTALAPEETEAATGGALVAGLLARARSCVAEAAGVPAQALPRQALAPAVASLTALEAQVAALKVALLAECDRRPLAAEEAATGTAAWAARLTGSREAVMAGGIRLGRLLDERYPATRDAFAAGSIGLDQVQVIVRAGEALPEGVTEAQRGSAEEALVAYAVDGADPGRLRVRARRMAEVVSAELADRQEAAMLTGEERRAEAQTWLTLSDRGDGTWTGRFVVPELHGTTLKAALERLSAPRRHSRSPDGRLEEDPTLPGGGPTLAWPERLGMAFLELIEHLPADGHSRSTPSMVVHLDYDALVSGLGAARLDGGARISPGEARRLACTAGLLPAVLGGPSAPLDLGREARLHTRAQRLALSAAHETCAAQGCQRPFAWCEIHHPHAWGAGGGTDLANALPLCGYHHRRAHDARFDLRRHPDGRWRFHRRT